MANINLNIQKGDIKVSVKMDNINEETVNKALSKSFTLLSEPHQPEVNESMLKLDEERKKVRNPVPIHVPVTTPEINKKKELGLIIENPNLIGSARSLTRTIEESAKTTERKSVIHQGGKNYFLCRIYCKNESCKEKTYTYIPLDQKEICCPKCDTKYGVKPAAPNGEKDGSGKYFMSEPLF